MKIRFERKCLLSKFRLAKNAIDPKGYNPIFQDVKIVADIVLHKIIRRCICYQGLLIGSASIFIIACSIASERDTFCSSAYLSMLASSA